MRITSYRTELNDEQHTILVKEKSCNYEENIMDTPDKIVKMINSLFSLNKKAEEHIYMIATNTKCRVLGVFEVSHGTVNESFTTPREIFIRALLCGAKSIILVHNHPSGDCSPSKSDFNFFSRMEECGCLLGVPVLDNIIIGNGCFYSYTRKG